MKEQYRQFCQNEKDIPIFSKDWWLDAVCGVDNWDVVLVEKGGQIVGALPYFVKKKNMDFLEFLCHNLRKIWVFILNIHQGRNIIKNYLGKRR